MPRAPCPIYKAQPLKHISAESAAAQGALIRGKIAQRIKFAATPKHFANEAQRQIFAFLIQNITVSKYTRQTLCFPLCPKHSVEHSVFVNRQHTIAQSVAHQDFDGLNYCFWTVK